MKKRLLSMLLASSVLVSSVITAAPLASAEEEAVPELYKGFGYEHEVKTTEPLYMIDFETVEGEEPDPNAPAIKYRNGAALSYGEGLNGGTALQTTGSTSFWLPMENALSTGQYLLSFDYKQNKNSSSYLYMRWNWDDGINTYFSVCNSKIGQVMNWSYQGVEYKENEWVHVNLFIDLDRETMDYYFNNEFYAQRTGVVDPKEMIMTMSTDTGLIRSYDNFAMYPFTNDLRLELRNMGMEMPTVFYDDMDISLSSKYSGNVFTEASDIEMVTEITNKANEKVKYDLEYRIENYYYQTVETGKIENCTIDALGTAEHKIYPKVDKYDIYTLYVTVIPDFEGAEPVEIDREFSLVHVPTYGYKNPYFGTCTHPGRDRTDWRDIERQFDISGIGYTRTDGNWGNIEPQEGVYNLEPGAFEAEGSSWAQTRSPNFFADRAAEGTENVVIFTPKNGVYNKLAEGASDYQRIANSQKALDALEKAAEALARAYKGKVNTFELGNELNFQRVEVMTPADYVKICQAAYKGFKKGNPDCTVLSHGHSRSAGDLIYSYLMEAKSNGGGKPFDGVAIHPYVGQGYPELTMWEDNVAQATEAIERAGYTRDDYQVWVTEGNMTSHTSYGTNQQHANALIRQLVLTKAFKVVDKFFMYQLQVAELNAGDGEHWFGCLQGRTTKNKNAARKTYLALCNYNALTENAEVTNTYRMDGDYDRDTVFAQYKRPDGKYITIMYTTYNCKNVTVDFGSAEGTIYDMDGNPTRVASADGKYTLTLTDTPVYFETDSDKMEVLESVEITRDKDMIELAEGGFDSYEVTLPEGSSLELVGTENMTIEQSQNGNVATVKVTATELPRLVDYPGIGLKAGMFTEHRMHDGTQIFRDYIYGYVKKDGVTTDVILLPVEYVYQTADITFLVKPYDNTNTKYWKGVIEVRNNKSTNISGTVTLTTPDSLKSVEPMEVKDLAPGETRKLTFAMPLEASTDWRSRGGVFTLTDGEEIEFWMGDTPRSKHYTSPGGTLVIKTIEKVGDEGAPKIDGVLDPEEWEQYKLYDFDKSQVSYGNQGYIIDGVVERDTFTASDDYGGKEDFSGSVYAKWDEEYLYAASIVYDDVHWAKQDPRSFYYDDVFYIGGKESNTQRHDSKVDVALSEFFDKDYYDESEKHGVMWVNYTPTMYGRNAEVIDGKEGAECYVVRKDTVTIYEVKIPWKDIVTEKALERRQCYLYFAHRDYDGDRDKSNSWGGWFYLADTER